MTSRRFVLTLSSLSLALALCGGCGPAASEASESPALEGLTLRVHASDHVAGTLAQDGATIDFDIATRGAVHAVMLRSENGEILVDSTLVDGIESTSILGGKLKIEGAPRSATPSVTGDRDALIQMRSRPEAKLLKPLRDALGAAGIDRALYQPLRGSAAETVEVKSLLAPTTLFCGQSVDIPTWSIWWSVEVVTMNWSTTNTAQYRTTDLWSSDTLLPPGGSLDTFGPYWNWFITVQNLCWRGPAPVFIYAP